MSLEVLLQWDEDASPEDVPSVNVTVSTEGIGRLKDSYQGTLSSIEAADHFVAWISVQLGYTEKIESIPSSLFKKEGFFLRWSNYDEERGGLKKVMLEPQGNRATIDILQLHLDCLEETRYIQPRGESVNYFDYLSFLGQSDADWRSTYPQGNTGEIARQLAWELEKGKRGVSEVGNLLSIPVPNEIIGTSAERVHTRLNEFIDSERLLGMTPSVVERRLRSISRQYERSVS